MGNPTSSYHCLRRRRNQARKVNGNNKNEAPNITTYYSGNNVKKSVRFPCQPDGTILPKVIVTAKSNDPLTPDDIRNLWYSDAECQDAERQAREDALIFLATTGSYHAALEQLLTQKCLTIDDEPANTMFSSRNQMAWEIAQVSKQARQEQQCHPTTTITTKRQNMYSTDVALRFVVDSPVRGLEQSFVLSALDRLESCHLYNELVFGGGTTAPTRAAVLVQRQRQLWRHHGDLTDDQIATLLAQQQRPASAVAARWARVVAQGDAAIVRRQTNNNQAPQQASSRSSSAASTRKRSPTTTATRQHPKHKNEEAERNDISVSPTSVLLDMKPSVLFVSPKDLVAPAPQERTLPFLFSNKDH